MSPKIEDSAPALQRSKSLLGTYLGVETSCDETAAAVVRDGRILLSNSLVSQIELHKTFGGVVPELAARKHLETVNYVIQDALDSSGLSVSELDAVAFTAGPGLIGTLLAGMLAAKTFAWVHELPLIAVDHLFAHIAANFIETDLRPPFIALLVSGGHTQIIHFNESYEAEIMGASLDDAAGEAYDKVARLLGLSYPGGAALDRLAQSGNPQAFKFPEGHVAGFDFSFSGLKTAVLRTVEKLEHPLPLEDLSASFQDAVTRVLVRKTILAARARGAPAIVLAGGVAANKTLRAKFKDEAEIPVYFPPPSLCTDNAAMVAAAAEFCGTTSNLSASVYSRRKYQKD